MAKEEVNLQKQLSSFHDMLTEDHGLMDIKRRHDLVEGEVTKAQDLAKRIRESRIKELTSRLRRFERKSEEEALLWI